tara:strand:+ start:130 stop:588 length:459 start_codon:yes stop_codon:yes gene_type:complete
MSNKLKKEILKHALFSGLLLALISISVPLIIGFDFYIIDKDCVTDSIDENLTSCVIGPSSGWFLHIFLCLVTPVFSVLVYRKKLNLIYRECFSMCFLTVAIGTLISQFVNGYNLASEYNLPYHYLLELQNFVFTLPMWAAYSFLLALFLKNK